MRPARLLLFVARAARPPRGPLWLLGMRAGCTCDNGHEGPAARGPAGRVSVSVSDPPCWQPPLLPRWHGGCGLPGWRGRRRLRNPRQYGRRPHARAIAMSAIAQEVPISPKAHSGIYLDSISTVIPMPVLACASALQPPLSTVSSAFLVLQEGPFDLATPAGAPRSPASGSPHLVCALLE